MLGDFRDFVMRGNVAELAVAVIIGAAFGADITAFTAGLITPLIALIGGKPEAPSAEVATLLEIRDLLAGGVRPAASGGSPY